MNVDVAAHGIDVPESIAARLAAGKPENPGQNPVTARVCRFKVWRIELTRRPTTHEYRVFSLSGSDFCSHDVFATWRAIAARNFPNAPVCSRNRPALQHSSVAATQFQSLAGNGYPDSHRWHFIDHGPGSGCGAARRRRQIACCHSLPRGHRQ